MSEKKISKRELLENTRILNNNIQGKKSEVKEVEIKSVGNNKTRGGVDTVKVRIFSGLESKNKLSEEGKRLREIISKADPVQAQKIKVSLALKHLEEQRKKGNVEENKKGKNFEKHELPEINAILYGFEYDMKTQPESI